MKKLLVAVVCFYLNFLCNGALAQQWESKLDALQGKMELVVDVSNMKDTVGRFYFMIAGQGIYPVIENKKIIVQRMLQEPRRCALAFIPNDKIKENPSAELNSIAAGISDIFFFLGIPGKNQITVNQTLANSEILEPSIQQLKYSSLLKLKDEYQTIFEKEHSTLLSKIVVEKVKAARDSLLSIYYDATILEFVKANPDAPASLIELEEYSRTKDGKNAELLAALFNNLTYQMKSLPMAELIRKRSDGLDFSSKILGKTAPDFTLNSPEGKAISLKDFRGQVTLIEFWASWCGPCRATNPGLVQVYRKHNAKGFKILGISLDRNRDQWLQAIKEDGLSWKHVADLKNSKNSAAESYKVAGVPTNFLVDKNGTVVALNLEVEQLDKKLLELL